jgi:hypothetical protein
MKLVDMIRIAASDLQAVGHDIVIGLNKLRMFDDNASKAISPIVQMAVPFVPQAATALGVIKAQQKLVDAIDDWAMQPGVELPATVSQSLQALRDAATQHVGAGIGQQPGAKPADDGGPGPGKH